MTARADGGAAGSLRSGRERLLAAGREDMSAAELRTALCELYERELRGLAENAGMGADSGFALVAFGLHRESQRIEPSPDPVPATADV